MAAAFSASHPETASHEVQQTSKQQWGSFIPFPFLRKTSFPKVFWNTSGVYWAAAPFLNQSLVRESLVPQLASRSQVTPPPVLGITSSSSKVPRHVEEGEYLNKIRVSNKERREVERDVG